MKRFCGVICLAMVVVLASCGGGGGGGTTIGSGTGSNSGGTGGQTLLTISLKGDYFSVPSSDPDFNATSGAGVITGLVQPNLGPNGFPVVTAKASDPATRIFDTNASGEIQWWTTAEPGVQVDVSQKADPLPFAFDNFYPTGQTGDATLMRTAHWKGTLNAPNTGTLIFDAFGDDDLWIFIDGKLAVDNGGVKGFQNPTDVSYSITIGAHTIDVFYADRSQSKATLALAVREQ